MTRTRKFLSQFTRSGDLSSFFFPPYSKKQACFNTSYCYSMMSFSKLHGDSLKPFLANYKIAKNQKGRDEVVKNAAEALRGITDAMEDGQVKLPKKLELVILY